MLQGKPKEVEEEMSTPKKTKFRRKSIEDNESSYEPTMEMTRHIRPFYVSLGKKNCIYGSFQNAPTTLGHAITWIGAIV